MAVQQGSRPKKPAGDTDNGISNADNHAKDRDKTTPPQARAEKRIVSKGAAAERREALEVTQAEPNLQRQAGFEDENSLVTDQEPDAMDLQQAAQKRERPLVTRVPISFNVRLTVNEQGQPQWTEIKHVGSKQKRKERGLDGRFLVAFMTEVSRPGFIQENAIPVVSQPELPRPKSRPIISEVAVFPLEDRDVMTLTLKPEDPFVVQVRFQLHGPDSRSLTAQKFSYELTIFTKELTSGKSSRLTAYCEELIKDVLEYSVPVTVPGLPAGLHRLTTVVLLGAPCKIGGFYGRTIVDVI